MESHLEELESIIEKEQAKIKDLERQVSELSNRDVVTGKSSGGGGDSDSINSLLRKLNNLEDLDQLLTVFEESVIDETGSIDGYLVNLVDEKKENLICEKIRLPKGFDGIEATYLKFRYSFSIPKEANVECYLNRDTVVVDIDNYKVYPESTRDRFQRWKMEAMVVIPIMRAPIMKAPIMAAQEMSQDAPEPVGTLMLFRQKGIIGSDEIEIIKEKLELFYHPLKNMIHYARLTNNEEKIKAATLEREQFLEFVSQINNLTSSDLIYQMISKEFLNTFPYDIALISMVENGEIVAKKSRYKSEKYASRCKEWDEIYAKRTYKLRISEGAIAVTIVKNIHLIIDDARQIMHLPMASLDRQALETLGDVRSVFHVPIRRGEEPIGTLSLMSLEDVVRLSEDDVNLIELLCSFIGTAIVNAKLYSRIEDQKNQIERTLRELQSTRDQLVDIERKRNQALKIAKESAEASAEAKSSFLANMSHEIRTPMNAIIGLTELVMKTPLSEKQEDYLSKISYASHSLLGVINDILDFSKIEAGKLEIESTDFKLSDVLDNLADMFSSKVSEKGIDIIVAPENDIPVNLIGDPLRLGQVLINLTSNAVKFTEQGEVFIGVKNKAVKSKGKNKNSDVLLEFVVSDTGLGIDEDVIPQLFNSFTQADGSTTRKFGGTGLGLSICKSLVGQMGGEIWVESEKGSGSKFYFTISLGTKDKSKKRNKINKELSGKKVLVIDNNEAMTTFLCNELQDIGFVAESSNSGKDAIQSLVEQSQKGEVYDLFIVDWEMPEISGLDTVYSIWSDTKYSDVPVILLITYSQEKEITAAKEDEFKNFLIKPVKKTELKGIVNKVVLGMDSEDFEKKGSEEELVKYASAIAGAKVLLAEDNEINQQVASEFLQSAGVQVDIANNGKEACDAVNKTKYDAVFMDIQMPVMDGYQATSAIRDKAANESLPIIAMTAHAMSGYREKCLSAGMNDYVTKPIDVLKLYKTLSNWVKPKPQQFEIDLRGIAKEEVFLPASIDGMDLGLALKKVGGNSKLLRKILVEFARDYSNAGDTIRYNIKVSDFDGAKRAAHTIKGLAGTFCAEDLQNSAAKLEMAIQEKNLAVASLGIETFERYLSVLVGSIDYHFSEKATDSDVCEGGCEGDVSGNATDHQVVIENLKELVEAVYENDFGASDIAEKILPLIKNIKLNRRELLREQFNNIVSNIENFDFPSAQKQLAQFIDGYKIEVSETDLPEKQKYINSIDSILEK